MAAPPVPASSSIFPEDVVKLLNQPDTYAVVTRCWADEQNPEAIAEAESRGIPFKPLDPGQLEVILSTGERIEVSESQVSVEDRGFMVSDLVRATDDNKGQAGTIIKLDTEVKLQRVLSKEVLPDWIKANQIVGEPRVMRSDHVSHGGWIGIVEEVFEMAQVQTRRGGPRRICDSGNALTVGMQSENFFLDRLPIVQALMDPGELQQILDVKQIAVAVNWLCMSQKGTDATVCPVRPPRFWTRLQDLCLVRSAALSLHTVGDKVDFIDREAHPLPPHLASLPFPDGQRVCVVTQTRSRATVLWQDGTRTTRPTIELEHCLNLDEDVDVFPGDIGMFTGCNPPRAAVVQTMNSKQRTIDIRYYDDESGAVETVSGLEFDHFGPPPDSFGVKRMDPVLVTKEGVSNGADFPTVPRLGESEIATGSFPSPESLRVSLAQFAMDEAQRLNFDNVGRIKTASEDLVSIDWYGEVEDQLMDGTVVVKYPNGRKEALPLDRLYLLDDGMDHDGLGPDMDEFLDEMDVSDDEWQTDEDGEPDSGVMPGSLEWKDEEDMVDDISVEENGWAAEDADEDEIGELEAKPATFANGKAAIVQAERPKTDAEQVVSMPADIEDYAKWQRFIMLEEAPKDHHYAKEPILAPSKSYMARVRKEHKVLATSLPPNILVRAYEDRADLMRCLIIGPLGTPFANAPFLFDMYLPPTKFPTEPPHVFFHAWSGATRVSPNLYAEGKVCLSLLNTWHGDKTESWSSARSSILQVVVSIQALIMTENPYYTEPGFEKQQGTNEGKRASEMYNERTLVLTRAFVQRAIQYPPTGFKEEIEAYYKTGLPETPGALRGIVEQSKALLEESAAFHEQGEDSEKRPESAVVPGLLVLTQGACLTLKRTVSGLEALLNQ
ncbi:hypothetical protein OIV83_000164 [Microbotryomycetes sp. JL201]|nr:hypothetical protein OIV83_000164 [Microbotryomycetes sp. JL201]